MSLPSRLLGANPSIQVSTLLSGSLTTPSAKGVFVNPTAYESISSTTVGSGGSSSVTLSSIPATYKHLRLILFVKGSAAGDTYFQFNSDTGSNYTRHYFYGTGTSPTSGGSSGETLGYIGYNQSSTHFQTSIIDIYDYANTNKFTTVKSMVGTDSSGAGYLLLTSTLWRSTSTVTSMAFVNPPGGTWSENSSFNLYGMKVS